ncbi:hypothetical protein [Cellulomonas sp. ATA003]|uniref:hypothetical protein n=1 Tax=Cellulomonas sp. ATA003 TaxID=3073064 RepID=UPI0028739A66|nr:hypothetical protein [Cellulomonas sp. ATA003]WNB87144.1 hypothetical protein REH70_08510 [Cellulomonas sp. ATA003]
MSLYAEIPARRARQLAGDTLVLAWVVAWVLVGRAVHDVVGRLAEPGRALESAGGALEEGLRDAAEGVARTPLLGDDLRAPFDSAGDAALALAGSGVDIQTGAERVAVLAGVSVAAWPVVLVAGVWAVHRWLSARRAARVRTVRDSPRVRTCSRSAHSWTRPSVGSPTSRRTSSAPGDAGIPTSSARWPASP